MEKWSELQRGYLKEACSVLTIVRSGEITEKVAFREWNAWNNKPRRVFFCFFSFAEKEKKADLAGRNKGYAFPGYNKHKKALLHRSRKALSLNGLESFVGPKRIPGRYD